MKKPGELWGVRSVLLVLAAGGPLLLAADPPRILLADDSRRARVTVSWPVRDGGVSSIEGERPYRSPGDKTLLGKHIECFVALGGTRVDKGAGHPEGAVVRVGLYKTDPKKPFFEGLADGGAITIRIDGVYMNQPATPRPKTGLMHLRYMLGDLANCGISPDGRNLYITASPDDKVLGVVAKDSARPGALDGVGPEHGSVTAETGADGSISATFRFPYALLRHIKDPSQRTAPGGFFEPSHFHCEVELVPKDVAAAEDAAAKGDDGSKNSPGH
jgi:hypothetical protein